MFKRFIDIMCANTAALDSHDRNIQMIGTILIMSIFGFFISLMLSFGLSFNEVVFFFIGFELFPLIGSLVGWFWDTLSNKFTMTRSKDSVYPSCEGLAVVFLFAGVAALVSITVMVGAISSFIVGFTFAFGFFYPALFIFLRRKKVFNESNLVLDDGGEVYGYNPGGYYVVGIVAGVPMFMYCFNRCFLYLSSGAWFICLVDLVLAFVTISLMLSPDLMNRVLPFELKKGVNFFIYVILCGIVSFLIMFFM